MTVIMVAALVCCCATIGWFGSQHNVWHHTQHNHFLLPVEQHPAYQDQEVEMTARRSESDTDSDSEKKEYIEDMRASVLTSMM